MEYAAAEAYDKVDPKQLVALRAQQAWIVEPIYRASDAVLKMPFFSGSHRFSLRSSSSRRLSSKFIKSRRYR